MVVIKTHNNSVHGVNKDMDAVSHHWLSIDMVSHYSRYSLMVCKHIVE